MSWQPIETAPKDGTWVLIAGGTVDGYEYTGVGIAAWHSKREVWVRDGSGEDHEPTHWMPLPELPEDTP